jgi:hypothetical protein
MPLMLSGVAAAILVPKFAAAAIATDRDGSRYVAPRSDLADAQVKQDLERISAFLHAEVDGGRELPWDSVELHDRWAAAHPGQDEPRDPYDGMRYGYDQKGEHFRLWSVGPDDESTEELRYDSRRRAISR